VKVFIDREMKYGYMQKRLIYDLDRGNIPLFGKVT